MSNKGNDLRVLTLDQSEEWDSIVKSFPDHDIYYLSGYVKAFKLHGDGEPLLFYYREKESPEGIRGIHVTMRRDISEDHLFKNQLEAGRYFDLATPYGYGGWILEEISVSRDEKIEKKAARLFEAYQHWCQKNHIVSEFVRFHPLLKNEKLCQSMYQVTRLGKVVTMELSSPQDIWNNMSSKNRGHIRKAINSGVKIYHGQYPEIYRTFQTIYNHTMDKDSADSYYYFSEDFYKSVLEDLPQNAQIFYAQIPDGTVIAATIILKENGRMNYHLSGSLSEYKNLAATNLLLYQTALWGNVNGYQTLYLGGGVGSCEDSLFQFKRAFYKGELDTFCIGKRIFDAEKYRELKSIRGLSGERDEGYFPGYRAKEQRDKNGKMAGFL